MLNKEIAQNFVSKLAQVISAATGTDVAKIDMSEVLLALTGPEPVTAGAPKPSTGPTTLRDNTVAYSL